MDYEIYDMVRKTVAILSVVVAATSLGIGTIYAQYDDDFSLTVISDFAVVETQMSSTDGLSIDKASIKYKDIWRDVKDIIVLDEQDNAQKGWFIGNLTTGQPMYSTWLIDEDTGKMNVGVWILEENEIIKLH